MTSEIELIGFNETIFPGVLKTAPDPKALPPGIDIHKQLKINTKICRGSVARKAMRMKLKDAKKIQMRLLKEEKYAKEAVVGGENKPAVKDLTAGDFNFGANSVNISTSSNSAAMPEPSLRDYLLGGPR